MTAVFLTATPNASVDKTFSLPHFVPGRTHHIDASVTTGGGKGVNVARIIRQYDPQPGAVVTTGLAGGHNGDYLIESLTEIGVEPNFTRISGESRLCIALIETDTGVDSKLNETGPVVSEEECDRYIAHVRDLARAHQYVALCGRVPPGARSSLHAEAVHAAQSAGALVALDTSELPLALGLASRPAYCKVNQHELEEIAGRELRTLEDIREVCLPFVHDGVEMIITLGANGAYWPNHGLFAPAPKVRYVSAVGAGDAFLGAMLVCLSKGGSAREALAWGIGAGASAAEQFTAGIIEVEAAEEFARQALDAMDGVP